MLVRLLFLFRLFCLYENALYGLTHMLMNKINCKQLTLATICLNPRHKLTFKNFHHLRTKSINYFWCVEHRFFFLFLQQFVLTPRTEEKYNKINQEFDQMMKKNLLHPVSSYHCFLHCVFYLSLVISRCVLHTVPFTSPTFQERRICVT